MPATAFTPVTAFMDFLDVRELKGPHQRNARNTVLNAVSAKSQYLYFSFRDIFANKTYGPFYLPFPTDFLSCPVGPVFASEWDRRDAVQKEMSALEQHCAEACAGGCAGGAYAGETGAGKPNTGEADTGKAGADEADAGGAYTGEAGAREAGTGKAGAGEAGAGAVVEKLESGVVHIRGMSKEQFETLPPALRNQFITPNYSRQARMQAEFPYQKFTIDDILAELSDKIPAWNAQFACVIKEPKKHGAPRHGSRKSIVEFLNQSEEKNDDGKNKGEKNGCTARFSDAVQELSRQKRSIDGLLASLDGQNTSVVDYGRKRLMVFLHSTAGIRTFYEPYAYPKLTSEEIARLPACIIDTEKKFFQYRHGANCHVALTYRDRQGNVFGEIHTTQEPGTEQIRVTEGETTIIHKIIVHPSERAMIEASAASVNAQNPFFIVAHNAPYDMRVLKYDAKESAGDRVFSAGIDETESRKKFAIAIFQKIDITGREVLDTFYLSRSINPDNPNHKLAVAMAKLAGKPVSTFKKSITYRELDELAALSDRGGADGKEGKKAALTMAQYVASDVTVVADRLFSQPSNLLHGLAVLAHTANVRVADLAFSFRAMEHIRDAHEFERLGLMFGECSFSKYNRQRQAAEEQKFRQSALPSFKQRWLEAAGIEAKIRSGLHKEVVEAYVPFEAFLRPLFTRRKTLTRLFLYLDELRNEPRRYFQLVQAVRAYADAVFFDYSRIVKVEERYYALCAKRAAAEAAVRAGAKKPAEYARSEACSRSNQHNPNNHPNPSDHPNCSNHPNSGNHPNHGDHPNRSNHHNPGSHSNRSSRLRAAARLQDADSLNLFPEEPQLPKNDPFASLFHCLFGSPEKGSAHRRRQLLRAYRDHGSLTRDMVHKYMVRHQPSKYYVGDTRETLEQLVRLNARFMARHGFWPQEMLDAVKEECGGLAEAIADIRKREPCSIVQAYGNYLYLDASESALEKLMRGPTEKIRYDPERRKLLQPVSWLIPLKQADILNRGRGERIYQEEGYFKGITIKTEPKKDSCLYEMGINKNIAEFLLAGKNDDAVDTVIAAFSRLARGQVPKQELLFYDSQIDLHFGRTAAGTATRTATGTAAGTAAGTIPGTTAGAYAYCCTLNQEPEPAFFSPAPPEEAVLSRTYHFDPVKARFFFCDALHPEAKKGRVYLAPETNPAQYHFSDEQGTYSYRFQLVRRASRSDEHAYRLLKFYYDAALALFTPDTDYFMASLFGVSANSADVLCPVLVDVGKGKITRTLEYGGLTREQRERMAKAFEMCIRAIT